MISVFINYKIYSKYRILQKANLEIKDRRMKLTTETFDSIKLLKLYNWENEFKKRILEIRNQEVENIKTLLNITTFNISLYWASPVLASITTIGVYQFYNEKLNISDILIGLTIFNMLQPAIRDLPVAINSILDTLVSMIRIEVNFKII
jgi:ABC-type multidrug transport system fused ATPase/permease subunit